MTGSLARDARFGLSRRADSRELRRGCQPFTLLNRTKHRSKLA